MIVAKLFFTVATYLLVLCHLDVLATKQPNVGIIGGHQILIEKAPYMASLRLNGSHWCGGSIIHHQFILTAAHCIVPNGHFTVLVGTDKIDGDGELYKIKELKIHPNFNQKTNDYDVSLIKLMKPLTFSQKVGKINLNAKVKLQKGTMLNVTGWGSTNRSNIMSPKLLQVEIPVISHRDCQIIYLQYKSFITSRMICAGNRGHDSCQGDSGGPLTLADVQVGVTSFGHRKGLAPGVYTKVSSVISWIMSEMH